MSKEIWISRDVLNWIAVLEGSHVFDKEHWFRAYEIWEHAKKLIENESRDFHLADGITNLKRAMNHRLQLIEKNYKFKDLIFSGKEKGSLELLAQYGLVRPFIMKNLMEIRNKIEHEDAKPPNNERCSELLDVTWYFLKSTDKIVQLQQTDIIFNMYDEDANDKYWWSTNIDFNHITKIYLRGWFPAELVKYVEDKDFFKVVTERVETKEDLEERLSLNDLEIHKKRLSSDIYIAGLANLNNNDIHKLVKTSLEVY